MKRLLATLGARVGGEAVVDLRKIHPGTYLGAGKIEEIKAAIDTDGIDALIIDEELSPHQLKNLEDAVGGKPVIDRPGVILEIFSRHARTREAKTQVELARVQYLLPRLSHYWSHFERQRGGGGGGGGANRGMGEKQLEVDRRLLKKRITQLKMRLKEVGLEREIRRAGRKDVLQVALVGYTNAGKSTLLNAMTRSHVLSKDELFSTLDSCARALDPHVQPPVVAIDTVGFISRIPTSLIASFRSTLEELHEADLLLHVVDASSPLAREQMETTEEVLKELGLEEKPRMVVLNKIDILKGPGSSAQVRVLAPGAVRVSALRKEDAMMLRDAVLAHFRKKLELWEVLVPYTEPKLESILRAHGSVETSRYLEKGTFYRVRIDGAIARKHRLDQFRVGTAASLGKPLDELPELESSVKPSNVKKTSERASGRRGVAARVSARVAARASSDSADLPSGSVPLTRRKPSRANG